MNSYPKIYTRKLILSGKFGELYEYEKPILCNFNHKNRIGRASTQTTFLQKKQNRLKTLLRAKQKIRRIIYANEGVWKQFVTLTFRESIYNVEEANLEFNKFRKRINYYFPHFEFKYIAVLEFNKAGAIHYHMLTNLPVFERKWFETKVWKNGFIFSESIYHVSNLGIYITKFINFNKKNKNLKKYYHFLIGKRSYFKSNNLKDPVVITEDKKIDEILCQKTKKEFSQKKFKNQFVGETQYTKFNFFHNKNQD